MNLFENKTVVITGGTGSLGQVLTRLLLEGAAVLSLAATRELLESHRLMVGQKPGDVWEFLR